MNEKTQTIRPPSAEPGLLCPRCGGAHLPVLYTRQQLGHIMRVRQCRHCGRRVTTREKIS